MEFILWNRKEFDKIYNCTGINVNDIPIEQRQYPITAIICILLGLIYYPLYFPCIYSFWKNKSKNPCYILLIYLSILDICILWVPTFAMGILSLNGVVYCSAPFITYFVGCTCLFFWATEPFADLILGINRCVEMSSPKISKILFHGKRIYIWIILCNLYGLYWLLFRHSWIFNGKEFQVLLDPLTGYKPFRAEIFKESLFEITVHNTILAVGSPIIYGLFIICLLIKNKELTNRVTKEELLVFVQIFIISMFNTLAGIAYAYNMNIENHGILALLIAHFSW
ncbi:hypothetical protein Mgra_00006379 [Meloidogyne graminicola]|uniref:Serpentine receptor class gamma n=1 Tax=Meloidogyne graminicola TaxID=189291 RepID=A0A8S9ZLM3_9BILA|nr:hypothetical protein Mgra_00006379 [Meloidogyne graminicola]